MRIRITSKPQLVLAGLLLAFFTLPIASAVPTPPAKPDRVLEALERKLHGTWFGQGPCDGRLILRAGGKYEREHQGPGGTNSAGTWEVRWDALPPTLVLSCKTSDDESDEGKTSEFKVTRLDDEGLTLQQGGSNPTRFLRAKK